MFWLSLGLVLGFFLMLRISSLAGSEKASSVIACLLDWKFSQFIGSVSFFFFFIVPHIVGKIRRLENRGSRVNVDFETPATEKTIHGFLQNKTKW